MKRPLLLSLLALAISSATFASDQHQHGLLTGMDPSVAPQQDFYHYVNGKWQKEAKIPADQTEWGTLIELNYLTKERSVVLMKEILSDKKYDNNPAAQRIRALHTSFMDLDAREKLGFEPLRKDFEKIDRLQSMADIEKYLTTEVLDGQGSLFAWTAFADLVNSRQNTIYLVNDSLGLPVDFYQTDSPENQQILQQYQTYIADILKMAGFDNTDERAKGIVAFEKQISQYLFTPVEATDLSNRNNPATIAEVEKLSKNINFARYLKGAGVETQNVVLWEPKFFRNFDKMYNDDNIATIKDYMRFKTVQGAVSSLNKALYDRFFDFFGRQLSGQQEPESLDKRAFNFVQSNISDDFARFYVEKYFPTKAKEDVLAMTQYLIKAYHKRIDDLNWMSPETKKKAKEKLDKFTVEVGYPNKWKDYDSLTFQPHSLYENERIMSKWTYQEQLKKVGKAVDTTEWAMNPYDVNAAYEPLLNRIIFPAAILQPPLYDPKADPAVNFGAIGAIIGHEITHGFDASGAKFDGEGNLNNWWTEKDLKEFEALSQKLVAQFNAFEVAPNVNVNGELTLVENIADLGGLGIAFDAFQLYQQQHGKLPTLDNLSPEQRFFMSWARAWRSKMTEQAKLLQVKTDSHTPGEFRAFAPATNIQSFHDSFHTKAGDKMYKAPAQQIKIW